MGFFLLPYGNAFAFALRVRSANGFKWTSLVPLCFVFFKKRKKMVLKSTKAQAITFQQLRMTVSHRIAAQYLLTGTRRIFV